jgi:pentatricopeptide repeat protein
MSFLNADMANAVNPYLTDVGVGLVFGLGYYLIKYLYGEQGQQGGKKTLEGGKVAGQVVWDNAKTVEDFNHLIKSNEDDVKMNPFEVLARINKKGLSPDVNTFNNLLNACYVTGNFESADKLVEELFDFTSPVQPDLSTYNILLKGVSCKLDQFINNSEEKAKLVGTMDGVFAELLKHSTIGIKPNDITINTMLDIMIKAGEIKRAWELFDSMKEKYGVEPDKFSYSTIIKALKYELDSTKLERAFGILEYLKHRQGTVTNDEIIFNCLIDVCLKLNLMDKAEKVFREMKEIGVIPSKITYAIMIKGYGQVYDLEKAFQVFEEMKLANIPPNEIIYGCLLNACVRCSNIEKVTEVYNEMRQHELDMNIVLYTTLIKAYTKVRKLPLALQVYDNMLKDEKVSPNIVIHNAMLDCCVECNDIVKMNEIYEMIKAKALEDENQPQPDLITYSTVIKGYARAKDMDKVFDIYAFLTANKRDFTLDEVIYNSILDGCAKTNMLERAMSVYEDMKANNVKRSNVTYSILVKLYANAKMEDKALQILSEMQENGIKPGIIVYTCLIQTCLRSKRFEQAINLFESLKNDGLKPDHVLYNTIVNGCLYNQRWELGCKYTLESFDYNVKIAYDIYRNVLEKLTMNYCSLKTNLNCDYATRILKALKERGIRVDDETYQKVARIIFKNQGVKINLATSKSPEKKNYNNFSPKEEKSIYDEKNYTCKEQGYNTYNSNKRDYNKDQLKWQRKNQK